MEGSTFVSANSPEGVGGFQISYGSKLLVPSSGDKLNAARNLASKVSPKLRYRGNMRNMRNGGRLSSYWLIHSGFNWGSTSRARHL